MKCHEKSKVLFKTAAKSVIGCIKRRVARLMRSYGVEFSNALFSGISVSLKIN